ncbi:MAG: CocE/NonD family hydrolase [Steroidobacteraceae bacterium]
MRTPVPGLLWAAALALLAGVTPAAEEPASASLPAGWVVAPELIDASRQPIERAWERAQSDFIPMADGTRLRYTVLLPPGPGPFPVVINYSGYDPGAIGGARYAVGDTTMSASLDQSLLRAGYAVLGVNARGTGCSTGRFDFLGPDYGRDGAAAVEWAAGQTWSSGAVGMANWSWAGMSQIATAMNRPPHLRAIAPGMPLTDPRGDNWAIGGVRSDGFVTGWWMYLHARWLAARRSAEAAGDAECVRQIDANYRAGEDPDVHLPSLLLRHPLRDAWTDERTLLDGVDRIDVPVLAFEAYQDEATTARAGHYHERLRPGQLWYVQSNGDHDLYESLQFRATLIAFLDHFVRGVDNGFERTPHLVLWQETGAPRGSTGNAKNEQARPRWTVSRDSLPLATRVHHFELAAGARLRAAGEPGPDDAAGSADSMRYPVPGPAIDVDPDHPAWGPLHPRWKQGSLAYTSAPLQADLLGYGAASADLWVSADSRDADLQVTLTELRPDGRERYVQRGWLRLSNRALRTEEGSEVRPVPCDRPQCLQALTPGVPVFARIGIFKSSYLFRRGSRIRLWVEAPSQTGGIEFDPVATPASLRIWHDRAHPSRLVLAELPEVRGPATPAACDAVMMQPCRVDPFAH